MKITSWSYIFVIAVVSHTMTVTAITKTREADVLNLNSIQDAGILEREKGEAEKKRDKDATVTESQENRSFFKPEADRRGSFYPSGPLGSPGLVYGPSSNFGPNFHSSGNGYSYGTPSSSGPDYPSTVYASNFPRPHHSGGGPNYGIAPTVSGPHHPALAMKGLLLPIAGVALLGAAAVLAKSHPVLLQLGVVSGKRKRSIGKTYPGNPFVRPRHKRSN